MTTPTDEPLAAQQLQQLGAKASAALQAAIDKLEARRFCLQLAVQAGGTNPVELAERMYKFLTAPTQVVRVTIDPP